MILCQEMLKEVTDKNWKIQAQEDILQKLQKPFYIIQQNAIPEEVGCIFAVIF